MALIVSGFCFRTSGSAAPFGQFTYRYENPGEIGKIPLPIDGVFFDVYLEEETLGVGLEEEGKLHVFALKPGEEQTYRGERNILGYQITFHLE